MDITRTIQANEKEAWVNQLFDGTLPTTYFPLPAVPKEVNRGGGDWLYVIYHGKIVGRCRIARVEVLNRPSVDEVGTDEEGGEIQARCRIHVECPGERAPREIFRRGHTGIRYDSVPEWSTNR